jgi:hypothetical protein
MYVYMQRTWLEVKTKTRSLPPGSGTISSPPPLTSCIAIGPLKFNTFAESHAT